MNRLVAWLMLFLLFAGNCFELKHCHAGSHTDSHHTTCCHSCGGHHVNLKTESADRPARAVHTVRQMPEPMAGILLPEDIFHPPAA